MAAVHRISPLGSPDAISAVVRSIAAVLGPAIPCAAVTDAVSVVCERVRPLRSPLSIPLVLQMIADLSAQLDELQSAGWSIAALGPEDIRVVNESRFILVSAEVVAALDGGSLRTVPPAALSRACIAPEVSSSPRRSADARCACFSIGKLVEWAVGREKKDVRGSKLHGFLERCFRADPRDRYILLV